MWQRPPLWLGSSPIEPYCSGRVPTKITTQACVPPQRDRLMPKKKPHKSASNTSGEGKNKTIRRTVDAAKKVRREEILDKAYELFQAGGVDAITVRSISRGLEMSPMAVYTYFNSLDELIQGLWGRIFARLGLHITQENQKLSQVRPFEPGYVLMCRSAMNFWLNNRQDFMLVYCSHASTNVDKKLSRSPSYNLVSDALFDVMPSDDFDRQAPPEDDRVSLARDLITCTLIGFLYLVISITKQQTDEVSVLQNEVLSSMQHGVETILRNGARPAQTNSIWL